ncbi:MAG: leucine-rich repeat domain-containing protein [Eubacterium sp.]|nr:leucine-rich repeat domain-containing protein [Eubacterium sp.]
MKTKKRIIALMLSATALFTSVFSVSIPAQAATKSKTINGIEYYYVVQNNEVIIKDTYVESNNSKTITIPSKISGKSVVAVERFSCWGQKPKTLVFPNSVKRLGKTKKAGFYGSIMYSDTNDFTAFGWIGDGAKSLETVKLGKGLITMEYNPFPFVKNIVIDKGNKNFKVKNGVLYTKDLKELVAYPSKKTAKSFTVPKTVKTIRRNAFVLSKVKTVNLNKVKELKPDAFYCSSVSKVKIGAALQTFTGEAFTNCKSLKTISIPKNSKRYSLKNGVLFNKKKTRLILYPATKTAKTYTVPKTVTTIGKNAFNNAKITKANLPSKLKKIDNGAFSRAALTEIKVPSKVTTIGARAYEDTRINKLSLPKSVTSLGYESFRYNWDLTSVDLSKTSLKAIKKRTFDGTSVKSVKLPNKLETIGEEAFIGTPLKKITIPSSVKTIKSYAFFNYTMTNLTIKGKSTALSESVIYVPHKYNDEFDEYGYEVTITAPKGSKAQTYAKKNNIKFVALS